MDIAKSDRLRIIRLAVTLSLVWTAALCGLFFWGVAEEYENMRTQAVREAGALTAKDITFAVWSASYGGIYVESDNIKYYPEKMTNPDHEEIVTFSGKRLTYLSPANVVHQILSSHASGSGLVGKLISKTPLNPGNAPNEWEQKALEQFAAGEPYAYEFTEEQGEPYLHYLEAVGFSEPCYDCHVRMNLGGTDTKGGIGVVLPMAAMLKRAQGENITRGVSFSLLWLAGLATIFVGFRQMNIRVAQLHEARLGLERFASAIDQAAEMVVVTDLRGIVQYVNPAFTQITGYEEAEALGKKANLLRSGEHDDEFYRDLWKTITGGKSWQGKFTNRKKDGTIFREEATISPVFDESDAIQGFVAVMRDKTQELKRQEELSATRKLEAIGTMGRGFVHDFNNLISVMTGFSELALEDLEPESEIRNNILEVFTAANHASELVTKLQLFTKKTKKPKGSLELCDLIGDAMFELNEIIPDKVTLKLAVKTDSAPVTGNQAQLSQVIFNLVENAVDSMERTGGKLSLGLERIENPDKELQLLQMPHALLTISDQGTGIAPEALDKIFDPFYTTKTEGEGHGLGLSAVMGIVEDHGGDIFVESTPGEGTSYKVYIPLLEESTQG